MFFKLKLHPVESWLKERVIFSNGANLNIFSFLVVFGFLLVTSSFLAQMTRLIPVLKSTLNLLFNGGIITFLS